MEIRRDIYLNKQVRGYNVDVGVVIANEVDKKGWKIIITKDSLALLYNDNGVLVMNVFDFLMNEGSLELQEIQSDLPWQRQREALNIGFLCENRQFGAFLIDSTSQGFIFCLRIFSIERLKHLET